MTHFGCLKQFVSGMIMMKRIQLKIQSTKIKMTFVVCINDCQALEPEVHVQSLV